MTNVSTIPTLAGQPIKKGCPLCLDNQLLEGGKLLADALDFYTYVFWGNDTFQYALITPKCHYSDLTVLPAGWGEQVSELMTAVLKDMGLLAENYNGYWNNGAEAGQTIFGHIHFRIQPRFANEPASRKGLGLLIKLCNEVPQ